MLEKPKKTLEQPITRSRNRVNHQPHHATLFEDKLNTTHTLIYTHILMLMLQELYCTYGVAALEFILNLIL